MRNFTHLIAFCSILLALASCGKEKSIDTIGVTPNGAGGGNGNGNGNGGGSSNGSEVGTWKFVSMHVVTSETIEFSMLGAASKLVTTSDFITDNNAGNFKFDGTTMFVTNWEFSVNTQQKMAMYSGNQLVTTQNIPFAGNLPSTTESSTYKKIGTDSLYFATDITTGLNTNGSADQSPSGYKLKWDGDKLYMTWNYTDNSTGDYNGMTAKISEKHTYVTTLQKQ